MNSDDAVTALGCPCPTVELAIFRLLVVAGCGGMSVGQISEELSLPPATLSLRIKELSHAGLIQRTQEGKFVYYRAHFMQMNELVAFLMEHCCGESGADCSLELPQCVEEAVKRRASVPARRAARV